MKNWILAVGCSLLLTTIINIILPDGKMKGSIKIVFSLLITLTIINPIFTFDYNNINFNNLFSNDNIEYQDNFLYYFNERKIKYFEDECAKIIENFGTKNPEVDIEYNINEQGQAKIKKISVYLLDENLDKFDLSAIKDKVVLFLENYFNSINGSMVCINEYKSECNT